jgi:hypothetical protein
MRTYVLYLASAGTLSGKASQNANVDGEPQKIPGAKPLSQRGRRGLAGKVVFQWPFSAKAGTEGIRPDERRAAMRSNDEAAVQLDQF